MTRVAAQALRPTLEAALRDVGVPAIGAGLVESDGRVAVDVIGRRRRGLDEPADVSDRWHLGSCGKSLTAALYARLVELGAASWDATMRDLFPHGAADIHPSWSRVTIDALLTHRAGMPANLDGRRLEAAYADQRPVSEQRAELTIEMLGRPADRPGRFRYSNIGYMVAGAAIERIAGMPYEAALLTHVLEPLGLESSGFGPPPELMGHGGSIRVGPYILGRGSAIDSRQPDADNPAIMSPAGRLHLTLADWARLLRVFLVGHNGLLEPASVERLLKLGTGPGPAQAMGWAPAQGLGAVSFGQQGSNTRWVATALLDRDRRRAAMVVVNDGRTSLLQRTAVLATRLLEAHG